MAHMVTESNCIMNELMSEFVLVSAVYDCRQQSVVICGNISQFSIDGGTV